MHRRLEEIDILTFRETTTSLRDKITKKSKEKRLSYSEKPYMNCIKSAFQMFFLVGKEKRSTKSRFGMRCI